MKLDRKAILKAHNLGDTATVQELLADSPPFTAHAALTAHRNGSTSQLENVLDLAESGQLEDDAAKEAKAPVLKTGSNAFLAPRPLRTPAPSRNRKPSKK